MTFILKRFIPAFLYFIVCTILLCLPNSSLQKTGIDWFNLTHVDKLVHVILFAILVYLFCRPIQLKGFLNKVITKIYFLIFLLAILYGFIMELVQKYLIEGRDFEGLDILADAIGAFVGYRIARKQVLKQVPPKSEELLDQAKKYAKDFVQDKTGINVDNFLNSEKNN